MPHVILFNVVHRLAYHVESLSNREQNSSVDLSVFLATGCEMRTILKTGLQSFEQIQITSINVFLRYHHALQPECVA